MATWVLWILELGTVEGEREGGEGEKGRESQGREREEEGREGRRVGGGEEREEGREERREGGGEEREEGREERRKGGKRGGREGRRGKTGKREGGGGRLQHAITHCKTPRRALYHIAYDFGMSASWGRGDVTLPPASRIVFIASSTQTFPRIP